MWCVVWEFWIEGFVGADADACFVRPCSGDVAWGVASAADDEEGEVE